MIKIIIRFLQKVCRVKLTKETKKVPSVVILPITVKEKSFREKF